MSFCFSNYVSSHFVLQQGRKDILIYGCVLYSWHLENMFLIIAYFYQLLDSKNVLLNLKCNFSNLENNVRTKYLATWTMEHGHSIIWFQTWSCHACLMAGDKALLNSLSFIFSCVQRKWGKRPPSVPWRNKWSMKMPGKMQYTMQINVLSILQCNIYIFS